MGGFDPLFGFMNEMEYMSTLMYMRHPSGVPFAIPITLDVPESIAGKISVGSCVFLLDRYSTPFAKLVIDDIFRPNKTLEALVCYGNATDTRHPSIEYLLDISGPVYVGGKLHAVSSYVWHFDYKPYRMSPTQLKREIQKRGSPSMVIGFQTRNPLHASHVFLIKDALDTNPDSILILHPAVGPTKFDDIPYNVRVETYISALFTPGGSLSEYSSRIILSLLPLAMRFAGPRETLLHMLVRKNFGLSALIIGRDHAGFAGTFPSMCVCEYRFLCTYSSV